MRKMSLVLGLAAMMAVGGMAMGDWPQWRGAGRDGKVSDFKAPASWPKELTAKWTVKVGGGGDSSMAMVGEKLYVFSREGEQEEIKCLNAGNGEMVWKVGYPTDAIKGPDAGVHAGPRAVPAVGEGKVVTLGVNGVVSCLSAGDGKLVWRKDTAKEGFGVPKFHTSSSPLIAEGMAIVQLGGGGSGAVAAYDLVTGDVKWKTPGEGAGYASPALVEVGGTKLVAALTDKSVEVLRLDDGKEVWKADFAPAGMTYNSVSPVVDGATVIYTGAGRGMKAVTFEKSGEAIKANEKWSNPDVAAAFCTPVLHEGYLYGLSAGAGGRRGGGGKFYCVDAKTGKQAWMDEKMRGTDYGAVVDAGSAIIALTSKGELTFIEPSEKGFKELSSVKVSEKGTFGYPIVSGNRIYVRDEESVSMYLVE